MRKIIIGDVHGCYDELIKLLEEVKFNKLEDEIIFIGDIMDRGNQSYDVFIFVKQLKEEMKDKCHYILGNHDMMIRDNDIETWNQNGSKTTIKSFNEHDDYPLKYSDWIRDNTELYFKIGNITVCHGGLCRWHHLETTIEKAPEDDIVWDRTMVESPWYIGPLFIVGHTPLINNPIYLNGRSMTQLKYNEDYELKDFKCGVIDIDTACVYDNKLTAMVIEEDKFKLYRVNRLV